MIGGSRPQVAPVVATRNALTELDDLAERLGRVERVLDGEGQTLEVYRPAIRLCVIVVSHFTGVELADIYGTGKPDAVVKARYMSIWLAHEVTGRRQEDIAAAFGRERSTVSYARSSIDELRDRDPKVRFHTDEMRALFMGRRR